VARKAEPQTLPVGKAELIQDGTDVAILGLGPLISMANELAALLERDGYSVALVNPRFIKPIDRETIAKYAHRVAAFVTFEDHVKMGGFGSAVVEALEDIGSAVPVVRIGWPDQFIEHGKVDDLRKKHGLSVDAALARCCLCWPVAAGARSWPVERLRFSKDGNHRPFGGRGPWREPSQIAVRQS